MPFGLLGLHLEEPDPLCDHAPHRVGHAHQPGEPGQCGHGGGLLESVTKHSKKFLKIDTPF